MTGESHRQASSSFERRYSVKNGDREISGIRLMVEGAKAGEVVVEARQKENTLFIDGLMVERGYRQRGLGRELLVHAENIARSSKLGIVALRPSSVDEAAMSTEELRRWYSRMGFAYSRGIMFKRIL